MATKVKQGAKTAIRYIVMAFLIVGLTSILTYFNVIGESFAEKVIVTFIALIVATILLYIATLETKVGRVLK